MCSRIFAGVEETWQFCVQRTQHGLRSVPSHFNFSFPSSGGFDAQKVASDRNWCPALSPERPKGCPLQIAHPGPPTRPLRSYVPGALAAARPVPLPDGPTQGPSPLPHPNPAHLCFSLCGRPSSGSASGPSPRTWCWPSSSSNAPTSTSSSPSVSPTTPSRFVELSSDVFQRLQVLYEHYMYVERVVELTQATLLDGSCRVVAKDFTTAGI